MHTVPPLLPKPHTCSFDLCTHSLSLSLPTVLLCPLLSPLAISLSHSSCGCTCHLSQAARLLPFLFFLPLLSAVVQALMWAAHPGGWSGSHCMSCGGRNGDGFVCLKDPHCACICWTGRLWHTERSCLGYQQPDNKRQEGPGGSFFSFAPHLLPIHSHTFWHFFKDLPYCKTVEYSSCKMYI